MATLRPSVENIRSRGNFTQIFRWSVSFEKLPQGVSVNQDAINFQAESHTVPTKTITSTEIQIRGNKVRQPGIAEYNSPITLTLMETVDNVIANFVKAWHNLCWQATNGSTGIQEDKSNLEATILLVRLNNKDVPIWTYKLVGCILEGVEWGDLDAATSDPMKPALSIAYDYFEDNAA